MVLSTMAPEQRVRRPRAARAGPVSSQLGRARAPRLASPTGPARAYKAAHTLSCMQNAPLPRPPEHANTPRLLANTRSGRYCRRCATTSARSWSRASRWPSGRRRAPRSRRGCGSARWTPCARARRSARGAAARAGLGAARCCDCVLRPRLAAACAISVCQARRPPKQPRRSGPPHTPLAGAQVPRRDGHRRRCGRVRGVGAVPPGRRARCARHLHSGARRGAARAPCPAAPCRAAWLEPKRHIKPLVSCARPHRPRSSVAWTWGCAMSCWASWTRASPPTSCRRGRARVSHQQPRAARACCPCAPCARRERGPRARPSHPLPPPTHAQAMLPPPAAESIDALDLQRALAILAAMDPSKARGGAA